MCNDFNIFQVYFVYIIIICLCVSLSFEYDHSIISHMMVPLITLLYTYNKRSNMYDMMTHGNAHHIFLSYHKIINYNFPLIILHIFFSLFTSFSFKNIWNTPVMENIEHA